uniref:Matrin-type domain-containing protein n=1 Tax=Cyprinus carpio TaxID=7962 RepID=A0A8C2AQR0_CYPCA
MQGIDRYLPERARSRSPVSRSLSPRSHSPSFTSCSSAHSPPGPSCRPDWSNDMGPRRDWTSHSRGDEDPRERDDWRNNEEERPNGWLSERRKPYLKTGDRISPRMGPGDERGRDWYPRGSPQGSSFSSYHSTDDFYKKDSLYKPDKLSRPQHQRHEGKTKRREDSDYHRPRHSESDVTDDTHSNRTAEDRGRSKRPSRRQDREEKESENQKEEEYRTKERSSSPHNSKPVESSKCDRDGDSEGLESVDDGEEESWYPKSMEELVTVDEVGGEDDFIVEPDLPDLHEEDHRVKPSQLTADSPKPNAKTPAEGEETTVDPPTLPILDLVPEESSGGAQSSPRERPSAPEQTVCQLHCIPSQEFKSASEETCSTTHLDTHIDTTTAADPLNNISTCESGKEKDLSNDERKTAEMDNKEPCLKQDSQKKDIPDSLPAPSPQATDIFAASPSQEQEKAISEHSIPLGVEFIVPRTGFYCNLCGLFYTSEQTAKTSHCRSTIHYRNLQKYLSQLAEESLLNFHTESPNTE